MTRTHATDPLRVMLVEDHPLVRTAIRRTLEASGIEVIAEAADAESALAAIADARPDVMLIDIDLPGMNGIQLTREIAPRLPDCKIIMLTGSDMTADLVQAVRSGASGYLTKDVPGDALVRSLLGVRMGEMAMPRRLAAELVRQLLRPPRGTGPSGLSAREEEVLRLVADGLTDREIGTALGISRRTVGRHVSNILDKLGARNRGEAARRYRESL